MIRLSFDLPKKRRLDLHLVKRRKAPLEKPLIPNMGEVLRARKGSRVSRFFRHIFEHKRIKKVLGTNIALIIIASSFVPTEANFDVEPDKTVIIQETTPLATERGIQYPVEEIKITQGYKFYHPGIDLDGITGDTIRPIMAGMIENVSYSRFAYGNAILVNHGNGVTSLYAHLSKINVNGGQKVTTDTKIGEMGSTGRAFGDHLHLEIRDHDYPINPLAVLPR
ncbi:MAG: M23 family metallopeptidase [Microgenomates group bacterium]